MKEEQNKNALPKGWKHEPFTEVAELIRGVSYDKQNASDCPAVGLFPIVRATNIQKGLVLEEFVYVPEKLIKDEQLIKNGDILVAMSSGSKDLVGKAAQANQDYQIAFGTFCGLIRPNQKINKKLFGYYFQTRDYRNYVSSISKGIGINNLRRNHIEDLSIPVPPEELQQQIVSKIEELFSELDKGIEELKTAQQQLKVYRLAVLKWAFEGKLTNEDVKDGELPEGWKQVQVKDVAETYGGYAFKSGEFKSEGKYQVLRMGNIRPGIIRYEESPVFLDDVDKDVLSRSLLKVNDVVITQTGTRKKRDYGFTVLIPKGNLLLNQRIAAIRFADSYLPKFFLYYSWTDFFKDQFFANETGNVGQGNVGMKAVSESLIPLCSIGEQQQIVQQIESRLSVCDKIEETIRESLRQAEALRQGVLKKAFQGKLVDTIKK